MGCLLAGAGGAGTGSGRLKRTTAGNAVPASPFNEERILGVMPDYQTVRIRASGCAAYRQTEVGPGLEETVDPFNFASVAMAAGFRKRESDSQVRRGDSAYGERIGAAFADFGTQNFFSAGVLANLLHQDPRITAREPATGVFKRAAYSVSRIASCEWTPAARPSIFRLWAHGDGDRRHRISTILPPASGGAVMAGACTPAC